MDKNMISIDDLVRQRLSGGEEPENPASWTRMRALLDNEMPQKKRVAGYYNGRKMYALVAGLALLTAATVGGYHMMSTQFNYDADDNSGSRLSANVAVNNTTASSASASVATVNKVSEEAATAKATAETKASTTKQTSAKAAAAPKKAARPVAANTIATKPKVPQTVGTQIVASQPTVPQRTQGAASDANKAGNEVSAIGKAGAELTSTKSAKPNLSAVSDRVMPSGTVRTPAGKVAVAPNISSAAERVGGSNTPQQSTNNYHAASATDNVKVKTTAPVQPQLAKDSMKKLTIVQRLSINPLTRVSVLRADTIAQEKFAFSIDDQSTIQPRSASTQQSAEMPQAPLVAAKNAVAVADAAPSSALVPLSQYKVQSRRTSKWDARTFDEMVRDVKFSLAQVQFYTGMSAGVNSYVFSPNNMGGIQLGLFGLFTFGDTWSAMAELKYLHRFNGGSVLQDNYTDLRATSNGFLQANVQHFFKFTTMQSIEMPLALRYAAGRLNIFGGVNLAYHFRVNAEEVTLRAPDTAYVPVVSPNGRLKASPTVSYNDFRSRFALGGLAGISYQITPSIQLDMRATKNFWDNAYGLGAEQVSNRYYNNTSMQFSIFYRFSQKNQIPRAR